MTSTPPDPAPDWCVVVPVKGGPHAKSRLARSRGVPDPALARALAEDCLTATLAAVPPGRVLVPTGDEVVAAWADRAGARVVADPGGGLDAAVRAGLRQAPTTAVAVLLGDLPALRPEDLRAALAACARHGRAVVPDAEGSGTVLLTGRGAGGIEPSFGPGSAARHEALGHVRLPLDLPRLRTDVDDAASLAAAVALGAGPRTLAALERAEGRHAG